MMTLIRTPFGHHRHHYFVYGRWILTDISVRHIFFFCFSAVIALLFLFVEIVESGVFDVKIIEKLVQTN